MKMKMKLKIPFFLFFLFFSIVNLAGESDVIGSHQTVKATVGQDVILPCQLEPPSDVSTLIVEWTQGAKQVHVYRSRADDPDSQDENYKDRTSLFHEEMTRGNFSLKLTKVTELDAGSYTCSVEELDKTGRVTLIVESEDDADKRRHTDNTSDGTGLSPGVVFAVTFGLAGILFFCTDEM